MSSPANYRSIVDWIAREAQTFALNDDAKVCKAIDDLVGSFGSDVTLLGFGEALHGGEEILVFRNRLFQRLVEAYGFSAIAIENSFTRGRFANEYVTGATTGDGRQKFNDFESAAAAGFSHGFGQLEANRELIEWMRAYNADKPRSDKIHFYGFDQPALTATPASPGELLRFVLDYLAGHDSARAQTFRSRIEPLLGEDSKWENPVAWRDPATSPDLLSAASELRLATEDIISELHTRRPELIAAEGERTYSEATHYTSIARQFLKFFVELGQAHDYAASLGVRDAIMADNLVYIVSRERTRGRVFAFAHNMHLQRGEAHWQLGPMDCRWWPAGSHMAATLGARYAVIGTAVGTSDQNGIGAPEVGSLEQQLTKSPGPARMLPTHHGAGLPSAELAALPMRSGSIKNPTYFPLSAESLTNFEGLIVFDSITYGRGGRPL